MTPLDIQLANWAHSTPIVTTISASIHWGQVVVFAIIGMFVIGMRFGWALRGFVHNFRESYNASHPARRPSEGRVPDPFAHLTPLPHASQFPGS